MFPDAEGEFADRAVERFETPDVFAVVEGGAGFGEVLLGDAFLELFELFFLVEVLAFYVHVFGF